MLNQLSTQARHSRSAFVSKALRRMLSQPSTRARHSRSAFVLNVFLRMPETLKPTLDRPNVEPALKIYRIMAGLYVVTGVITGFTP
ncbi:hypothetical protein DPMN_134436 [Dreissena polymorpha]|uniref:Uncharacterized protein n=1 Tax=Dreissena polymorpha TaxID=45954 RepID=A0A9D4JAP8_DREPO|nr:hypothetical protein DPMN_134436 [Dreissena polymorpha]